MKRQLFVFVIGCIGLTLFSCNQQDAAGNSTATSANTANSLADTANFTSIQWLDTTYQDLGKVKKGQVVEISWRFKNAGTRPLVIQNVRPGCGCTVADKPEAPLAPGETGTIKGKFDSNNQNPGEHRKYISVDANTSGTPYHQLNFRVEVVE